MGKGPHFKNIFHKVGKIAQPATPAQHPTTFYPPLAMQQSVWDSIVNGNFIDAKIFAFSRRSHEPGQVDTPKVLFVNTHVLATACGYFRSMFDFPNGIETSLRAGLPPGVEPTFDLGKHDFESDYDDPVEENPVKNRQPVDVAAPTLPERTVKAYIIKYTSYRTLRAIIWYIYTGDIAFSHVNSPEFPSACARSIYQFADEHGMGFLKRQAFDGIAARIDLLGSPELIEEAFSVFTSRYPELQGLYINGLRSQLSSPSGSKDAFRRQLSRYLSGELPHSGTILTTLLQSLMDGGPISDPRSRLGGGGDVILRVSPPWPGRTEGLLRASLDKGTFEDFHLTISPGPASTKYLVYFAGAADEGVGSPFSRVCRSNSTYQHYAETSLLTWQAIAYYMYTDCISFKPPGLQGTKPARVRSPSDMQFRGYPCSPREVLYLAHKLAACEALINLMATEISSYLTPENVVDEMFGEPPLPPRVINRGVEIIQSNRENVRIRAQLQKKLEEGASGGNSVNPAVFSACFGGLFGCLPSEPEAGSQPKLLEDFNEFPWVV